MSGLPEHSKAFRTRRFLNWFPMGLTYAFLYMGRYNLTVSKNALGDLMTKEDFGIIFAAGTFTEFVIELPRRAGNIPHRAPTQSGRDDTEASAAPR